MAFNIDTQQFEVHTLDNNGSTYAFTVPFGALDNRILQKVEQSDLKKKSLRAIIREIDKQNEVLEKRNERERRDMIYNTAVEMRPMFKRLAEEVY